MPGTSLTLLCACSGLTLSDNQKTLSAVPPLLTLIALVADSAPAGILGALLAIPMAGALQVLVLRLIASAVRRWSGAEE